MTDYYNHLIYHVGLATDTPVELIKSTRRMRSLVLCRQIVWHFMYTNSKNAYTYKQIARLAGRHHSTILHGIWSIKAELTYDRADTCVAYSRFLRSLAEAAKARAEGITT
jgi:chromosomal replication initiation ATPase DnaA